MQIFSIHAFFKTVLKGDEENDRWLVLWSAGKPFLLNAWPWSSEKLPQKEDSMWVQEEEVGISRD